MPTDKEIEEAIEWAKLNGEVKYISKSNCLILADAYLSVKAERDKYKAIVEVDTKAMEALDQAYGPDNDSATEKAKAWDKIFDALALRENKEE